MKMNPNKKAWHLVKLFLKVIDPNAGVIPKKQSLHKAKVAALCCVDEMDAAIDFDADNVQNLDRQHNYFKQVREELEKL